MVRIPARTATAWAGRLSCIALSLLDCNLRGLSGYSGHAEVHREADGPDDGGESRTYAEKEIVRLSCPCNRFSAVSVS
jgi:hypothetical protein